MHGCFVSVSACLQGLSGLAQYFAMARGTPGAPAMDMSKFYDTNYHYVVSAFKAIANRLIMGIHSQHLCICLSYLEPPCIWTLLPPGSHQVAR